MWSTHVNGVIGPRHMMFGALAAALAIGLSHPLTAQQVVPGNNVNMVSGTEFPTGDPFLQRQNEPSLAVSTRNPLHLMAGANDYRTVDLPGPFDPLRGDKMNADAWVGLYKSFDGGRTWQSTLLPGYPQDTSAEGTASPIKGRQAGTDAVVKAGTNGLFYYAGLAFDRGQGAPSTIFVSRFIDLNNRENGDPIAYVDTRMVDTDAGTRFLDKTALAVDVPRGAASCTIEAPQPDRTTVTQTIPAGPVYVAYSAFTGSGDSLQSKIMFSRSADCGATWSVAKSLSVGSILSQNAQIAISPSTGTVWVSWRRFKSGSLQTDAIYITRSTDGGVTFSTPVRVSQVLPFDQSTTETSFRTNAFQTMTVDAAGRVYVAWPQRGQAVLRPDPTSGDARIVVSTSTTGSTWTLPKAIETGGLGHQLMPSISFHAGKLRLIYYDLREDVSQVFGQYIDELPILNAPAPKPPRHTIDVYVSQALPAAQPVFTTARLSDYAFGTLDGSDEIQRLQYNPPNLPLFRQGTAPFIGDYIDLASAPPFVQNASGAWVHNTAPTTAAVSHGVWTDNRDVRAPIDGDWTNYTPVMSDSLKTRSLFDPTQTVPPCSAGQTGMRNQNLYTAKVTEGLFIGSPGNTKPLGSIQRAFVIIVENTASLATTYRLRILNQPSGGQASFTQFTAAGAPLTQIDAGVPPLSTVARTVYVTATDALAQVAVSVDEIAGAGAPGLLPGGQSSMLVLNADPTNPSIQNPSIQNPSIQNPDIQVAEAYNPAITTAFLAPSIQNPSIQNPSIQNPSIQNPSIQNPSLQNDAIANPGIINPSIQNPSIQNPSIQNPSIQNPSIQNQDLVNGAIQDTTWQITNDGNTTASYAVKLLMNGTLPDGFKSQLVLHKTYTTPSAQDCQLALQPHTILLANIPNPAFTQVGEVTNPSIQNPSIQNATLSLAPGETANVTLRIVDPNRFDGIEFDAGAAISPAVVAHSVNTEDAAQGITTPTFAIPLTITTAAVTTGSPGTAYFAALQTFSSSGTTSWIVTSGSLPPGIVLDPATGQLSGTPTTPGNYVFTVQAVDANGNIDTQTLSIKIDPITPDGFSRTWNGADTNWSNPKNWSPAGVPTASDSVYISAAIPVTPTLTMDVTVLDLVVEDGATVNTNGFTLTILGNGDAGNTIVGSGWTRMLGAGVTARGTFSNLIIGGNVIVAGPLTATGDLTLLPGALFNLNGHTVNVGGQLVVAPAEAPDPTIVGNGWALNVAGVDVDGLILDRVALTISHGELTRFDNVRFVNYQPEDVHITVNHTGTATPFAMSGLSFFVVPTSGRYLHALDAGDDGQDLVLNVSASLPADGSSRSTTDGGAVINWLFDPNSASIGVTQFVSPAPAVVGVPLTYTLLVANGGPAAASNVVLTDAVPAGTTFVSAVSQQGSCSLSAGVVTCALGTINAGSSVIVTLVVLPSAPGQISNAVSVSANESDSAISDNAQTVNTPVVAALAAADLSLTKVDSADPAATGVAFTYTLVVQNSGPASATNVVVTDALPALLSASAATSTHGSCTISGQTVTCLLGTLLNGEQASVTITATASGLGVVTNTASVSSAVADPNPANNVATELTMVGGEAGCNAPTFSGPFAYTALAGGPATFVRLADMNADGAMDIVTAHQGSGAVSVLLNTGAGSFGGPIVAALGQPAFVTAVADFNKDGHLDVMVGVDGTPNTLRLLLGDGSGALLPSGDPIPVSTGFLVEAADLDSDGDHDVLARGVGNDLVLFRNDGSGGFAAPQSLLAGPIGLTAVTGDFNGDSRLDIIAVVAGRSAFWVLLANDEGGYLAPVEVTTASAPRVRPLGDLNGDGHLDLAVTEGNSLTGTSRLTLRFGNGAGGFGAEVDPLSGGTVNVTTSADINGDGHPDLVTTHAPLSSIAVQLGNGTGGFVTPVHVTTPAFSNPAAGDLNGDGRADIVVGDAVGTIRVLLNACGKAPVDLGVTLTESADPVAEGVSYTHTVTVTNHSASEAADVRLTSVVKGPSISAVPDASITSTASAAGTLTSSGVAQTWLFPAIPAGGIITIAFEIQANAGTTLLFSASVTSDGQDTNGSNNTVTETTTITAVGRQIVVTNTNNTGPGSLRQAIISSNADTGDVDRIVFAIPGPGPHTIVPLASLPALTQPAIVDGTTQPGFAGTPIIELNGNGLAGNGLTITGGSSTVRGLVVNRFGNAGIQIHTNGGNAICGNFIGTDQTGTIARPNTFGVLISGSANNLVGCNGSGNVISGNVTGAVLLSTGAANNTVSGNLIGTTASGTAPLGNGSSAIFVNGPGNIIGGSSLAASNVIASSTQFSGIHLDPAGTGTVIRGNFIGTDRTGTVNLGGIRDGIFIKSSNNVVGGSGPGQGNTIRFNAFNGVVIAEGTGNRISGNAIFDNGQLGIDLAPFGVTFNDPGDADTGANNGQNFPVITSAVISGGSTIVQGTLHSTPSTTVDLEFFSNTACDASGHGEGQSLLGTTQATTNASGNATFTVTVNAAAVVTATATDPGGNTSEFSQCRTAASSSTFAVTNTNDSGAGSLRQAILNANANAPAIDTIVFQIGSGPQTITPASFLPVITDPVIIDGTTQPGYAGVPLIELNGVNAGANVNGIHITAGNSTVRGLVINRFGTGAPLQDPGGSGIALIGNGGNLIEGNYIGTNANGTSALPNRADGIWIDSPNNVIGGTTAAARNVISGNGRIGLLVANTAATGNQIKGNFIGTDASGAAALGNTWEGVVINNAPNNTVGGTEAGARNVISGNTNEAGVLLTLSGAMGNLVAGNYIGVDVSGALAVPNLFGVRIINGASNTLVGGTVSAARNVISGNTGAGVNIQASGNFVQGNTIGLRPDFSAKVPNTNNGVSIAGSNNVVGGSAPGLGNVITGNNGNGITVSSGSGNQILGNSVGLNPTGDTAALSGNTGSGLLILGSNTVVGGSANAERNWFHRNGASGVRVGVGGGTGNAILFNSIHANGGLGIDLAPVGLTANDAGDADSGPNNLQNFPVLTSAVRNGADATVAGTFNSTPSTSFRVQFFGIADLVGGSYCDASGNGEGQTFLAESTIVTDGSGNASINIVVPAGGSEAIAATATDPGGNTSEFSTCVTIVSSNQPPVANAGPDQVVPVGGTVQLDGSGSSDPDSNPLTYTWILNTRPAGSTAILSTTNIANPTFVADLPGTYIAQLVVNDGLINSPSDTVTITTQNQIPIANAGPDQAGIAVGATVNLNGSGSSDPDGHALTYSWSFVVRPAASTATLLSATTVTPSFVADRGGLYRVQLVVNDGQASSVADTVDVITVNQVPAANAGIDQTVLIGSSVQLNGNGSSDPDGNPLTYAWTLTGRPVGSGATLANPTAVNPSFVPDLPGIYTVRLVVNDGFADSEPDNVTITAITNNISLALVGTPLVGAGRQATLGVTLPAPAPAGGVIVTITSDNTNVLTVGPPNTVTIAEGATTGQVVLNGITPGTTMARAVADGYSSGSLSVTVTQNILTAPATLNVPFGQNASFPVNIPQPAPAGGIVVTLVSSNSLAVEVLTPTVTIPQGAVSASGTVQGAGIGTATVTATHPSFSTAESQVSSTGSLNIIQASVTYTPTFTTSITIQLESGGLAVAAPPGGVEVTLTPANPACASPASPVTIPQGLTSVSAVLGYGGTATLPCATTVTASASNLTTDTVNVTVNSDPGISVNSNGATIGAGLQNGFWTATLGISNHGGVTVRIASSDSAVALVSPNATTPGTAFIDVPVVNGNTSALYYLQGVEGATGTVTITASSPGFTDGTGTLTIVPAAMRIDSLPATSTSLSADDAFWVVTGTASAGNANLSQFQSVRGGGGLTVTLTNSNAAVAQLTTSAGSGQTRTVIVGPNQQVSPTSVATGGVAFDPLAGGTTTVSASAPGVIATTAGSVQVTVSAPGITVNSNFNSTTIGAGLHNFYTATLGGANHGGVTVRIASSNAAVALVSPNATTAGTAFIDVPVANTLTSVQYYLQGVEGATGTVTITASAPGFTDGTGSLTIVPAALRIESLPATSTSLSADAAFWVRTGTASAGNASLSQVQSVRGGGSLTVTLTNSNAAVAQLTTSAGSGQTRTVTVGPNQQFSPTSVATGGVAFDPLAGGTTTVSASAPGVITTTAGSVDVTVSAPGISLNSNGVTIGAGLQNGLWTATLGGANHGGVTVRIASSNAAVALVSPNATTAGTAFIDVPVANTLTSAPYYLQGVEGATGTVTITASAPGFVDGTGSLTIVPAALRIDSLSATSTSLSADVAFWVRTGTASAGNANLSQFQSVRGGGSLTVTLTNSNAAVAQLTTSAGSGQTRTVTVGSNQNFSPTSVAAGGVAFDPIAGGATTVSATATGVITTTAGSVEVTVSAPGISLNSSGTTIGAGLQNGLWSATLGGANHGGVTVRIASSNAAVALVSPNATTPGAAFIDVPVTNGNTNAFYYLQGVEGATGTVTITASATGFTDGTGTLTIVQPALRIESLPTTSTSLSADVAFWVRTGTASAGNANLSQVQSVRAGGSITVTLTNSNAAVAQLTTLAGSGQMRTVTVGPNQQFSPTSVAAGGVAFDPLAQGPTTVSASATGFITTTAGSVQVTVTAPGISVNSNGATIGAGLQNGFWTTTLGGANHGGVTVRIASSNAAVALVSPNATTPGTAFIDVAVANGNTSASYYLQGVEGATGTVTITASAPGFVDGTGSLTIAPSAVRIEGVPSSIDATAANVVFLVRAGILNSAGTDLQALQSVRAGPGLTVTLQLTQAPGPAVAQLVTSGGAAQTRTVTIAGGQSTSPGTVNTGGIAFDPLQAGSTTVTGTAGTSSVVPGTGVTVEVTSSLIQSSTTKGQGNTKKKEP